MTKEILRLNFACDLPIFWRELFGESKEVGYTGSGGAISIAVLTVGSRNVVPRIS